MSAALASAMAGEEVTALLLQAEGLLQAQQTTEAVVLLTSAVKRHPGDVRLLKLSGRTLLSLGAREAGVGALEMALALEPGDVDTHAMLADAMMDHGDFDQALVHRITAFQMAPDAHRANELTRVLLAQGRFEPALATADHALSLRADCPAGLTNRAVALQGLQRWAEAVADAQHAVALAPNDPVSRHNLAMMLLRLGQYTTQAWDLFEARLALKGKPAILINPNRWRGEAMAGRTLLLLAEQGLGDTLQFARYAPLAAVRAGRVILAVQPPLIRLLCGLPGVDQVVSVDDPLPAYDLFCPLLSLPQVFRTTLATIPPPLLPPRPASPPTAGAMLRVGLAWAGSPTFARDDQRSIAPDALAPLTGMAGVRFYSLQRREGGTGWLPEALGATDLMADVQDFADTAALVEGLDLVITVDTAMTHLAATMAKPVWLLNRSAGCWRWLHGRADSPWYPTLRVIQQRRINDWSEAMAETARALATLAS